MPELPEVEVTRRSFADRIAGARIVSARTGKPLRWALGCDPTQLVGRLVQGVRRRGKYLLVDLDDGLLLVHLGMSGSLAFAATQPPPGPHDHFDLATTRGVLRLNDPRHRSGHRTNVSPTHLVTTLNEDHAKLGVTVRQNIRHHLLISRFEYLQWQ